MRASPVAIRRTALRPQIAQPDQQIGQRLAEPVPAADDMDMRPRPAGDAGAVVNQSEVLAAAGMGQCQLLGAGPRLRQQLTWLGILGAGDQDEVLHRKAAAMDQAHSSAARLSRAWRSNRARASSLRKIAGRSSIERRKRRRPLR